jgi:hypothetical protein
MGKKQKVVAGRWAVAPMPPHSGGVKDRAHRRCEPSRLNGAQRRRLPLWMQRPTRLGRD